MYNDYGNAGTILRILALPLRIGFSRNFQANDHHREEEFLTRGIDACK